MFGLRRVLTSSSGTSATARTAANAVANRVAPSGLEAEQWIAADVEDCDVPVFSEPLTIDELNAARSSLEAAIAEAQEDPQLAPAGSDGQVISEIDTSNSSDVAFPDPDRQMQLLDRSAITHSGVKSAIPQEFLDAAFIAAQAEPVRNAVVSALLQSPEARASLERALAGQGLAVHLTTIHAQGQPALPPAAAALQSQRIEITDVTDAEEPGQGKLGRPLEGFIDGVVNALGEFGGNVRGILRKFIARWKHRIDRLFNPGAVNEEEPGAKHAGDRSSIFVDALSATAALIVIVALVRRVPVMR